MAGASSTDCYSSFSCEAVLHGQSWARDPPLASTVALPLLAAPRADAPGKSSRTDDTVVPIVPRTRRLRWRLAGAEHTEDSRPLARTPSKHRSTTSSPQTKHQPALSAATRPSRLTRSIEPVLHALPPRLMHSLQARGHFSTVSQSPKWPPRTLLSVITS